MSIEFRERPIRERFHQYFREPLNQLIYEFEDDDLERMKQRAPQSFMWGSSQSRRALPIRLMVSVVMKMASPGKAAIHHEFSM